MTGDNCDDDVIICCVCVLFMYFRRCARVIATCYLTVSAGTLWGLFGLARQIRGWYWGRWVCWLSASQLPMWQGHSGALCRDEWRSTIGGDKVGEDRKGGDEGGEMMREQKRRRRWRGQRTERGVSRGDRHCKERGMLLFMDLSRFSQLRAWQRILYVCTCMRKIQALLSLEHAHSHVYKCMHVYVCLCSLGFVHVWTLPTPLASVGLQVSSSGWDKIPTMLIVFTAHTQGIRPAWQTGTRYYHVCRCCFWFHSDFLFTKTKYA